MEIDAGYAAQSQHDRLGSQEAPGDKVRALLFTRLAKRINIADIQLVRAFAAIRIAAIRNIATQFFNAAGNFLNGFIRDQPTGRRQANAVV